jgi:tRNA A-37 threonylcarbamoyl transferase component Bud32
VDLKRLRNPFFSRQRITEPDCFFGRQREIEALYSAVITHQCRAVVGERKLGKSSLLTAIAQPALMKRYGLDPEHTLFLYLDMEGMASAEREDFWVEVLDGLSAALRPLSNGEGLLLGQVEGAGGSREGPASRLLEWNERLLEAGRLRFTTVRRLLRRVRDAGLDLVLTLDEFEGLARNPNFETDFYGELRSLAGELGIVYFTASKRGLYDLTYSHSDTLSSPFFNIFSEMPLGLMAQDEAIDLVTTLSSAGEGPGFCEEEVDLALELAGPHPFFLQIAGFHLYELPARGESKPPDAYDHAARRFNAEAADHYRYLWSQLSNEEQQALLSPNAAKDAQRKLLEAKALIRRQGQRYVPFGHAFAVFLEDKRYDVQTTPTDQTIVESTSATDLTGKRLGNFRVLAALGQGGMAKVYKGYQPMLDRYVAIKVLAPHFATDEEFRARFQREASAIARLRQSNIVQVYDFGVEGQIHYMVMEYIAGDTLKHRIRSLRANGERLPTREVLSVLRGIAAALDYAHERDIIHRDVKPANIMLRVEQDGEEPRDFMPVLTDFGVAKIMEGVQFTGEGMTIGTPDYMAPEQGSGETVTCGADLYSLGIILYEMLSSELPFTADTPVAVLLKHISDTPPPIHSRAPDLPPALDAVLERALAKRPEHRYPSGAALVQAVELALGFSPTSPGTE